MDIIETFSLFFQNKAEQEQFKALMSFLSASARNVDNLPQSFLDALSPKLIALAAVLSGRLALIKRLNIDSHELKGILKNDSIAEYLLSKQRGEDVIAYLDFDISDNKKTTDLFSQSELHRVYGWAAKYGHTAILTHLEGIKGSSPLDMASAFNYAAFRYAARNGQKAILTHLEGIKGFNRLEAASALFYEAYLWAAKNGHEAILIHLESIEGFNRDEAASARGYAAFRYAAENGHEAILSHLESIEGFNRLEAASAYEYEAYRQAAINGHKAILTHLESIEGFNRLEAASARGYEAYREAAQNGHEAILIHLESIEGFNRHEAAKSGDYLAYSLAAENGHEAILIHLEGIEGFNRLEAASSRDYAAYRWAAENGHEAILSYLEGIEGFNRLEAAKADNYGAFLEAAENGHEAVLRHLLKIGAVFSFAEKHDREYGEDIIYEWVDEKLKALFARKAAYDAQTHNGVFDLNEEEAKYYLYVLRNLIRRGVARYYDNDDDNRPREDFSEEIRLLLEIPAIKSRCHEDVTAYDAGANERRVDNSNELLRLAIRIGNTSAIRTLLRLPEVLRVAQENSFYRGEIQGDLDLRRLAQDRESSMVALSPTERQLLEKVKTHYQPKIESQGGYDAVFTKFKEALKSRYNNTPAMISLLNIDGGEETIALPLDWDAFQTLCSQLTPEQQKAALEAYYEHDVHTAYRYLSNPNPWMHPHASYVYVNEARTARWSSFEEYLNIIVPFYLAAFDDEIEGIDGYSREAREALFIKQLALIGRAHNWDKRNEAGEEYDDKEADKPSCYSGVKRRLWQAVLGHPFFQIITEEKIRLAVIELTHTHFQSLLTSDNVHEIYDAFMRVAYDDYEEGTDVDKPNRKEKDIERLAALNLSEQKINDFIDALDNQSAGQIKENHEFIALIYDFFTLKDSNQHLHIMLSSNGIPITRPLLENIKTQADKDKARAQWAIDKWKAQTFWNQKKVCASTDGSQATHDLAEMKCRLP